MLIRIVRMVFREEEVGEFLQVFNSSKDRIRNFPGCLHLELMKDYESSNVYFTYSHWEDDMCLDEYRQSEFFRETWSRTKPLFKEKARAYSIRKFIEV